MTSQQDDRIPFGFSHNQQTFRLLELTPPLMQLLASEPPPTLTIKSAPVSSLTSAKPPAVLCTAKETFWLREVQSSNSIYLIRPSDLSVSADGALEPPTVSRIASPKAILELHPAIESSVPQLRQLIPLYHGPEDEDGDLELMKPTPNDPGKRSKTEIFADVPYCEEECEKGWAEIVAFEHDGFCMRPSASALLSTYKALFTAATSQGIDFNYQFQFEDLWQAMEEDGYPRALAEALLTRIGENEFSVHQKWAFIDRSKFVSWLGGLMLESQSGRNGAVDLTEFITMWKNNLPESWREDASLDSIKDHILQLNPTSIRFRQNTGNASSSGSASAPKANSGARKWHEKFRNTG